MTHSMKKGLQAGFTLVEILVALIILAVITAFVVPDVINRADDADAPRLLADVMDLGTGVELFKLDLKTQYPTDLEDLVNAITVTDSSIITDAVFGNNDVNKWEGPYIKSALVNGGSIPTGYNGVIHDNFVLFAIGDANGSLVYKGTDAAAADCVSTNYIAIPITGLSVSNFEDANNLVDGTQEVDGGDTGESQVLGKLRFAESGDNGVADPDSTFYLMTPCH